MSIIIATQTFAKASHISFSVVDSLKFHTLNTPTLYKHYKHSDLRPLVPTENHDIYDNIDY